MASEAAAVLLDQAPPLAGLFALGYFLRPRAAARERRLKPRLSQYLKTFLDLSDRF